VLKLAGEVLSSRGKLGAQAPGLRAVLSELQEDPGLRLYLLLRS